jgi:hypothetical protein
MRNIFIFLLLGANGEPSSLTCGFTSCRSAHLIVLARGSKGGSGSGSKGKDTKNEDKDQSKPADPISTPSPASSLPADISGASTLAPTMDSAITTTSSPTNTAAQETRSVSPEMQRLFGVNNRPNLTHVFDSKSSRLLQPSYSNRLNADVQAAQRATEFLPTAGEMATADGNTPEKPTAYSKSMARKDTSQIIKLGHSTDHQIYSLRWLPASSPWPNVTPKASG